MTVVDVLHRSRAVRAHHVSILVLVDDGRRPHILAAEDKAILKFQSLFLWMTVVDASDSGVAKICDRVSILVLVDDGRRRGCGDLLPAGVVIVSILVLVDDGRRRLLPRDPGLVGHDVSILVLVDDGRRPRTVRSIRSRRARCFNPCSCG